MDEWIWQWKGKLPADEKAKLKDWPDEILPESNAPPFAVKVWVAVSLFRNVTAVLTLTVSVWG